MTPAAVFDLDGTLTDTSSVDGECFLAALRATFGIDGHTDDWSVYDDVTDSGILADIVRTSRGTEPDHEERERFIKTFLDLLNRAYDEDRSRFAEIPGARGFMAHLTDLGWTVTIATGGWRASALLKLDYGGFAGHSLVLATANDGRKRTDIVRTSLARAGISLDDSTRIVVFGDAIWDVHAAGDLGLPLIGVAQGPRAKRLRAAGAFATIPNFADRDAVFGIVQDALARRRTSLTTSQQPDDVQRSL